uniref:Uncharacterized protein n=1 Tax=Meloidogyne javanica TaxID=6303 RepID=A0A915MP52_MELJA
MQPVSPQEIQMADYTSG